MPRGRTTMRDWSAVTASFSAHLIWGLQGYADVPDSSACVPSSLRAVMSSLHTLWKCHGLRLRAQLYFFLLEKHVVEGSLLQRIWGKTRTTDRVLTQNFKRGSNVTFYITVRSVKSHLVPCLSKGQLYETAMFHKIRPCQAFNITLLGWHYMRIAYILNYPRKWLIFH